MEDLVSVIIPVHNRAAMLREAVASALAQTHRPIEILIVDDGSTDDTAAAADALAAAHAEVIVIHHSNRGPGLSREAGRLRARGAFLQYLDSDDLLLARKFELQLAALRAHPECGVAYGRTRYRNPAGEEITCTWKNPNQVQATMFPSFLLARWWETATPLYRRGVTDAAGPWTELRLEEDWEYDARIASLGTRLAFVDEVVCEHRDHGDNRLSRGAGLDAQRLRWRARAHELIYAHAQRAGVSHEAPEMQHFARELFLLARMCGAAGLAAESRTLFELAREASGPQRDRRQFRAYRALTRVIGWTAAGKLSQVMDRIR
ncbi:MAG TPA: glycosyltransferase family A protein [Thermoanaerobaculia bacterium]|nr:glycosyltransferase family A protein [Thermoanaerobaculia bacterium]